MWNVETGAVVLRSTDDGATGVVIGGAEAVESVMCVEISRGQNPHLSVS
jgi:hypothetical protein